MSSRYLDLHLRETRSGRIIKPKRQAMIAHQSFLNKDYFPRGADSRVVDFSRFGCLSDQKYGESFDELVIVCSFQKTLSAGQLIEFGDPVRSVMD